MKPHVPHQATGITSTLQQKSRWHKALLLLAAVVVFCTVYALILPALALENKTTCGFEEHQHNAACYENDKLVCKIVEHVHTQDCYADSATKGSSSDKKQEDASDQTNNNGAGAEDNQTNATNQGTGTDQTDKGDTKDAEDGAKDEGEESGKADEDNAADVPTAQDLPAGVTLQPTTETIDLKMYVCTYDGTYRANDNKQHYKPGNAKVENVAAGEAYTYTADNKTYYLIPLSYFDDAFKSAGYAYNKDKACPFQYGKSKEVVQNEIVRNWDNQGNSLTLATYEAVEGKTYVQLQDINDNNWKNIYYAQLQVATDTVSPSNAVINLFDYWTEGQNAVDIERPTDTNYLGINKEHPLKFFWSGQHENTGFVNYNTQQAGVLQGIVSDKPGDDGYPHLSGNKVLFTPGTDTPPYGNTTESLAYLFDPSYTGASSEYRAAHANVKNLLSQDADGYFWYDAAKRGVEYNPATNSCTVYTTPLVVAGGGSPFGQFFPFEDAHQAAMQSSRHDTMRHYYGMSLSTRFAQQYGGHTNATRTKDTTFTFTGDDDVWIFVDGVLVADLGGVHSANGVEINFATGEVKIDGVDIYDGDDPSKGHKETVTTTIYEQFKKAGKAGSDDNWVAAPGGTDLATFADNTSHTLDFYYLERGNWDSTLSLRYNLSEIPPTAIYKVNQYGDAVAEAGFSVFAADDKYNILSDKGGNAVTLPEDYQYDQNGNIVDSNGAVLAKALYTGKTDSSGEMIFQDEHGAYYSLAELEKMFGRQFILKETKVPDGYRIVSDDIRLRIQGGALVCDNTYESGVWASPTLQVTSPNDLTLVDTSHNPNPVKYYEPAQGGQRGVTHGTLFAVPLKYIGPTNEDGTVQDVDTNLPKQANWAPVSGNPKDGYSLVKVDGTSKEAFVDAAIETAQKPDGRNNVFTESSNGAMEATLENLPGKVVNYYHMLGNDEKDQTQYTIGYYWTSADSLDGATSSNTFRVNSEDQSNSFYRVFGADIEVPNLSNRLLVQKFDEDKNLVNGATFALFEANEDGTYKADDGTIDLSSMTYVEGTALDELKDGEYTFDVTPATTSGGTTTAGHTVIKAKVNGEIKTITSHEQRTTNNKVLADSKGKAVDGTCVFGIWGTNLTPGCYYLREVEVPDQYQLNTTPIMVRVTEDTIYANAGAEDDGVTVARGPGYIVAPLHKAASQGDIDETLTWIYQKLKVSPVSNQFGDATADNLPKWKYETNEEGKQLVSCLKYSRTSAQLEAKTYITSYTVDDADTRTAVGDNTVRTHQQELSTDVGWSYNEIFQDYDYGKEEAGSANYTDLRDQGQDGNVTNLFSRSVYVQVTDKKASNLEISKEVISTGAPDDKRDPEFTFNVMVEGAEGEYECAFYNTSDTDRTDPLTTRPITFKENNASFVLKGGQIAVIKGLPGGAKYKYSVTEKLDSDYSPSYSVDGGKVTPGHVASGDLAWDNGATGDNTSEVAFTNTYQEPIDLLLNKLTMSSQPLAGAQFALHVKGGTQDYYHEADDGTVTWAHISDEAELKKLALTTDNNGHLTFKRLPDGVYSLQEVVAPEGYNLLEDEITFTVQGRKVVSVSTGEHGEDSVTVYNSQGYELPKAGGSGVAPFLAGGLLLTVLASFLLYRRFQQRREGIASK